MRIWKASDKQKPESAEFHKNNKVNLWSKWKATAKN